MKTRLFLKLTTGVMLFLSANAYSQGNGMLGPVPTTPETGVLDGVYVEEHVPTKKVIPYEYLREADAIWSKRVWRVIDLREKINLPLYFPLESQAIDTTGEKIFLQNNRRWSLWSIIKYHAYTKVKMGMAPDITVYANKNPIALDLGGNDALPEDGDQFKYPLLPPGGDYSDSIYRDALAIRFNIKYEEEPTPKILEIDEYGNEIYDYDSNGDIVYEPGLIEYNPILSEDIVQYHIKEDWFFDKERSVMDQRILGIAPVIYDKTDGQVKGYKRLFWVYFPECRYVFQNYFVYNRKNDSQRMSFDDIFWKRQFSSYVYKESNVHDRSIDTYKVGVDALLESERIKEDIFKIEHDVWHF